MTYRPKAKAKAKKRAKPKTKIQRRTKQPEKSFNRSFSKRKLRPKAISRTKLSIVDEASLESFPASDPPAFTIFEGPGSPRKQ